ncbi:MAG TPA: amidohydrolase family protein [Draconibacterium sp.]|nr:amidohydrolase family protein [Draconibacterium sp.]
MSESILAVKFNDKVRKIAATYIFPGNRPPIKNGILICENDGTILEIQNPAGNLKEKYGLEFYSGILVPGFVNTHCHLELSHLNGKIEEKTGISDFVGAVNRLRNVEPETIEKEIFKHDRMMHAAGIAAVGDISNSVTSLESKKKSKIFYHTFVETFGFHPARAERAFEIALSVQNEFRKHGQTASIVPHSAYSVSKPLFDRIRENVVAEQSIVSIHNQESRGEAQFFKDGGGSISYHFRHNLGIDVSHWEPTGKSSLISVLPFLPGKNQLLLIHNTFTEKDDIEFLKKQRSPEKTFWVLCPNSNLFIENQLPPISLFREEKLNICLGTDSLASNHQLSVLAEMITLQKHFPELSLEELVQWATINGARALKIENRYGSLETGKKPGINLIAGIDFKKMKLTGQSKVKRLV